MSVLGAIDFSKGVSSGTAGDVLQGEALLGVPYYLSSRVSDEMGHMS